MVRLDDVVNIKRVESRLRLREERSGPIIMWSKTL